MGDRDHRVLVALARGAYVRGLAATVQALRSLAYRAVSQNRIQGHPRRSQPLQAMGLGHIECEERVQFGYFPSPYWSTTITYLDARQLSATIRVGAGTVINNNACIIAESTEITIGRNCVIGANVVILDSDFHALDPVARRAGARGVAQPVVIQDDVFIGHGVTVLKGVTLGRGAVIASGSVVTHDVPAGAVAAGVPARVLTTGEPQ